MRPVSRFASGAPLVLWLALMALLGLGLWSAGERTVSRFGAPDASGGAGSVSGRGLAVLLESSLPFSESWSSLVPPPRPFSPAAWGQGADGPVLVNFFASWCAPCHAEHGTLMALGESLAEVSGSPAAADARAPEVFGIVWKDRPDAVSAWLGAEGNPFARLGSDRGEVGRALKVRGVPTSFLISRGPSPRICWRTEQPLLGGDAGGPAGAALLGELRAALARCH